MTQNTLGHALLMLGESGDNDALRPAVQAYEAALQEPSWRKTAYAAVTERNLARAREIARMRRLDP